jgi:hypothetical protein
MSSQPNKRGKVVDPCPEDCMERLATDLIAAVKQKVRLTDPEKAAQMSLYNLEVQLVDILRLIGEERQNAIAAAQAEAEKLTQAAMISEAQRDQFIRRLREANNISDQIQNLNLTLTQIEQFKAQISKAAENNHWDDYDSWVAKNFSSIPQEEIQRLKNFVSSGLMYSYDTVLGGYNYVKNYGLPTWYFMMTAICRLPKWCQDILRKALGPYAWILDQALVYCAIWEAQAGMITYKKVTTLEPEEVDQIKKLFDRAYSGSCLMFNALLGSITRAGLAAGAAANTAFLQGLHAVPGFEIVPGNFSVHISGTPPSSQSSEGSQADSVSSSSSVVTCGEGPPDPQDVSAQPATFILPPGVDKAAELDAISDEINQLAAARGAYGRPFNFFSQDSTGSMDSYESSSQESNSGGRRGRKSRRYKKRKATLKRRGLKRRMTRKGKKRRHTKKRR